MSLTDNFTYLKAYQQNDKLRTALNQLAETTFQLSFEAWYQAGYWKDKYIPYTLFDGDKAVANVSVNILDFNTLGEYKRYIQLGTVMTDEKYRHQGLSRWLMQKVWDEWHHQCEFIYLYANSTVWDFYPKLGYTPVKEFEFSKYIKDYNQCELIKLDMSQQINKNTIYDYVLNSYDFAALSMQANPNLIMFYCMTAMKDNVYFIPSLDVIVIAKFENTKITLFDVFSKNEIDLEIIINAICDKAPMLITLGFTPKDPSSYEMSPIDEMLKDEKLFVQSDKTDLFQKNNLMFPILSHT